MAPITAELLRAYTSRPIAPLSERGLDRDTAVAVRAASLQRWIREGRVIAGRKIGATTEAVRRRIGATEPAYGYLFADSRVESGGALDCSKLIQPRVEAEICLLLSEDITSPPSQPDALLSAIGAMTAAIEVVDCRIEDWRIGCADLIADNGCASHFVLSASRQLFNPRDDLAWTFTKQGERPHSGQGCASPAQILHDLHWLAVQAICDGAPLRKGEFIMTGAWGDVLPMAAGEQAELEVAGLGGCTVRFH